MQKILFVCAQNKLRSPTAENIFSTVEGLDCASAGIHESAANPINREIIEWADLIFTMESKHKIKIQQRFQSSLNGKKIISLDIPDNFQYMEQSLIELLRKKVTPYISNFI